MGMNNEPPSGFATLLTLTLSPPGTLPWSRPPGVYGGSHTLTLSRVKRVYVTESPATAVDSSPGIKHVASKTATPSPLLHLRDGDLKSGKWTHQDAKNAKNWVFRWKEKIKSSRFLCNAKNNLLNRTRRREHRGGSGKVGENAKRKLWFVFNIENM